MGLNPSLLWHFFSQSFEESLPSKILRREVVNGGKSESRNLRGVAQGLANLPCRRLRKIPIDLTYRDGLSDIVKPAHATLNGVRVGVADHTWTAPARSLSSSPDPLADALCS